MKKGDYPFLFGDNEQAKIMELNMDEKIIYDGFERVWKLFEKTDSEIQQLRYLFQETKDLLRELAEQSKETLYLISNYE